MNYQIIGSYSLQKASQRENPPVHVYVIRDPETKSVRYVGKTIDPAQRARNHRGGMGCNWAFRRWIASHLENGRYPTLDVVEIVGHEDGDMAEQRWMNRLLDEGCELFNQTHCKARKGNKEASDDQE